MLERTSFSDSQRSEVFDDILFDSKTGNFGFALFHLNYTELKYGEGLQSNTIHCKDELILKRKKHLEAENIPDKGNSRLDYTE